MSGVEFMGEGETVALRCQVTNHICGTELWMVAPPCRCRPCRLFVAAFEQGEAIGREQAAVAERTRLLDKIAKALGAEGMGPPGAPQAKPSDGHRVAAFGSNETVVAFHDIDTAAFWLQGTPAPVVIAAIRLWAVNRVHVVEENGIRNWWVNGKLVLDEPIERRPAPVTAETIQRVRVPAPTTGTKNCASCNHSPVVHDGAPGGDGQCMANGCGCRRYVRTKGES